MLCGTARVQKEQTDSSGILRSSKRQKKLRQGTCIALRSSTPTKPNGTTIATPKDPSRQRPPATLLLSQMELSELQPGARSESKWERTAWIQEVSQQERLSSVDVLPRRSKLQLQPPDHCREPSRHRQYQQLDCASTSSRTSSSSSTHPPGQRRAFVSSTSVTPLRSFSRKRLLETSFPMMPRQHLAVAS